LAKLKIICNDRNRLIQSGQFYGFAHWVFTTLMKQTIKPTVTLCSITKYFPEYQSKLMDYFAVLN